MNDIEPVISPNAARPSRCERYKLIKVIIDRFHSNLAKFPFFAGVYMRSLSVFSRNFLPQQLAFHLRNLVLGRSIAWPPLEFGAKQILSGNLRLRMIPHLGEFDQKALFSKQLMYEPETFEWLKRNLDNFDTVIEIGANVGVFTLYIRKLLQQKGRAKSYSFEPSPAAFERLIANLKANGFDQAGVYNLAVAEKSGFLPFFCPKGHLTNGSFSRDFAAIFSNDIAKIMVAAIAADDLRDLARGRCLMKIDVEGYEPKLLAALAKMINECRPWLMIEVLEGTDSFINNTPILQDYVPLLLSASGPVAKTQVVADRAYRDWIFIPKNADIRAA